MTRQEKAEYLGKYKLLEMEIARRCEELGKWRMRSRRCQTQSQKEERLAARRILAMEKEIAEEIQRLCQQRKRIKNIISSVDNDTLRLLLEYRYLNGCTLEKTAEKMNYTFRHICRLHFQALDKLSLS